MSESVNNVYGANIPERINKVSKKESPAASVPVKEPEAKDTEMVEIQNVKRQLMETNQISIENRVQDIEQARVVLRDVQNEISKQKDTASFDQMINLNQQSMIELLS